MLEKGTEIAANRFSLNLVGKFRETKLINNPRISNATCLFYVNSCLKLKYLNYLTIKKKQTK